MQETKSHSFIHSYFAIINIRDDNTSSLILGEQYKYVVIPSVFNGSEVWNVLTNKDLLLLNRLQHFVAQKCSTLE